MSPVHPRASVLMPVHNGEAHLGQAIESILGQSFADLEVLIIDDGSTDGTADIVAAHRDPRIRFERLERRGFAGGAKARNRAFRVRASATYRCSILSLRNGDKAVD